MADIDLDVELGTSIEDLSASVQAELNTAVGALAQAAHAAMISKIQSWSVNPKNRQDYLRGLKYQKIDDLNYIIYLEGEWANKLESGFPGYSIKDQLLSSTKTVGVGSRAGEPWVRQAKDGSKYASVPFEHKPYGEGGGSGDLASEIKKLTAMNVEGKKQKITRTFKDLAGNPMEGKVASVGTTENPFLAGLTKFQKVQPSGRTHSLYLTFRTVSSNSDGWNHPGFDGYKLFEEAERYIRSELANIIETLT